MNALKVFNIGLIIETAGLLWKYECIAHRTSGCVNIE